MTEFQVICNHIGSFLGYDSGDGRKIYTRCSIERLAFSLWLHSAVFWRVTF